MRKFIEDLRKMKKSYCLWAWRGITHVGERKETVFLFSVYFFVLLQSKCIIFVIFRLKKWGTSQILQVSEKLPKKECWRQHICCISFTLCPCVVWWEGQRLMRALWPWERHNVSEPLFSHTENALFSLLPPAKIKWKSALKIIKLCKNVDIK